MKELLIIILLFSVASARELVFATIDSTDVEVKINTAIMREAYRNLEIEISLKHYPPERALLLSDQGEFDGELFRLPVIEERYKNLVRVNVPLGYIHFCVVSADSSMKITSWNDIGEKRVAILRGIKHLQMRTEGMKRTQVDDEANAYKLLQNGRADIYIGVNQDIRLKEYSADNLFIIKPPIETLSQYHYLHRSNSDLKKPVEDVLNTMQKSGRFDAIRLMIIDSLKKSE